MNRDFKWLRKLEKALKKGTKPKATGFKPKKKIKVRLEHPVLDSILERKLLRHKKNLER